MGIIRATRQTPAAASMQGNQVQQQRVRAREATGNYHYQEHESHDPHGPHSYDRQQERRQQQRTQQDEYAEQQPRESSPENWPENWDAAPNETLDFALHLASHDSRLSKLEQALGQLNQNMHDGFAAQATERSRLTKLILAMAAFFVAGLVGVALVPRYMSDATITAKIDQAVRVIAANMAVTAPSAMSVSAARTTAQNTYAPVPVPQPAQAPATPAYATPTFAASSAPVPSALGAQIDQQQPSSARAMIVPVAPPSPPVRVAQVFTSLQNKIRAHLAKDGGVTPSSWQPMFDRDAKGDMKGRLQIAAKFLKGEDVPRDQDFAVQIIRDAANAGEKEAIMWLAYAYEYGNLGKVDLPQAVRWFEAGTHANIAKASTELGHIYEAGLDGAPDPDVAMAWYQKGAQGGDVAAAESINRLASTQQQRQAQVAVAQNTISQAAQRVPVAPPQPARTASAAPAPSEILMGAEPRASASSIAMMMQPAAAAPLNEATMPDSPSPPASQIAPTMAEGSAMNVSMDNAGDVKAAQRMLKALGYKIERVDGQMGPQTSTAIRTYERTKMLPQDGIAGPQIIESLMNDMRWGNQ